MAVASTEAKSLRQDDGGDSLSPVGAPDLSLDDLLDKLLEQSQSEDQGDDVKRRFVEFALRQADEGDSTDADAPDFLDKMMEKAEAKAAAAAGGSTGGKRMILNLLDALDAQ